MSAFDVIQFLLGMLIVIGVLYDVFQAIVVPRWSGYSWRVSPVLLSTLWPRWKRWAFLWHDLRRRNEWLGVFAPFALMLIMVFWVTALVIGYGVMLHALRGQIPKLHTFGDALYLSGVGLLTIGFGDIVATGGLARVILLSAGASGLAVFALVLSLTFSLYGLFAKRETLILTLDARAGSPPSGVALLTTYAQLDMRQEIADFFHGWEMWAAQLMESHLSYPILPYFRSSHNKEAWITALGSVLDAATLLLTTAEPNPDDSKRPFGTAQLMYRTGCHAVRKLEHYHFYNGLRNLPEPDVRDAGVERIEWEEARTRLAQSGFALREPESAWLAFQEQRAVYARGLNALAHYFATPPAPWIGDRSSVPFTRTQTSPGGATASPESTLKLPVSSPITGN